MHVYRIHDMYAFIHAWIYLGLHTLHAMLLFGMSKSQSSTVNRQPSIVNRQLSTVNHQPSTVNRQPPTINRQQSIVNSQPSTVNLEIKKESMNKTYQD